LLLPASQLRLLTLWLRLPCSWVWLQKRVRQ
jgi:hypothetical protein